MYALPSADFSNERLERGVDICWDDNVLRVNGRDWAEGTLIERAESLPEGTVISVRLWRHAT